MACGFQKVEICKILTAGSNEPSKSKWAAAIVFDSKKDGLLGFWADYWILDSPTGHDSHSILRMVNASISFGDA